MFEKLFRTKSVEKILADTGGEGTHLNRSLTYVDLIFMGVGAVIGAGIFATIGTAAAGDELRLGAGPALLLSFLLTGVACGFSALCYAEFAAMVPISGSAYTYAYATLGELTAWIIGWDLIIEYAIGNVAVAISWSSYFVELLSGFGIHLPAWLAIDYRSALVRGGIIENAPHLLGFPIVFNLPAVAIVAFLTFIIYIGIKESARFNQVMVLCKFAVLAFFCGVGVFYVKPENFVPFMPTGWAGVQAGAAIIFFAYIGFDAVSTLAEETKDPARDMPLGIIGTLVICTIIYMVVTAVFVGLLPYAKLKLMSAAERAEPLSLALKYIGSLEVAGSLTKTIMNFSAGIVAFGSVVASTAVLLVFQIGQPRIFFSMARDGLLPKIFMSVHPKYHTPSFATIVTGVFVAIFAAFMNIDEMVDLCNIGTLFAFMLVCLGVAVLQIKEPNRKRPFKVPGGPIIPILGIFTCMLLASSLPAVTWKRFLIWLIVGIVIYYFYGSRHSRLGLEEAGVKTDEPAPKVDGIDKF